MYGFSTQSMVPFDAAVANVTEAVLQFVDNADVRAVGKEVRLVLQRVCANLKA